MNVSRISNLDFSLPLRRVRVRGRTGTVKNCTLRNALVLLDGDSKAEWCPLGEVEDIT